MSVVTQDWKEIYFYSTELYLKNTPKMKEYINVILNNLLHYTNKHKIQLSFI